MSLRQSNNPSARIFWLVTIGFVLVCAYFTIWTYQRDFRNSERASLLRLEGIANSLALQIDGDLHRDLTLQYTQKDAILFNAQDTNYYKIHHILGQNFEANMLESPVYTMIFDSTKRIFQFIATSAQEPYFRHAYDRFPPVLAERYTEGGVIPMYSDTFGTWLSAFAPIRDMKGKPVAVVMVDERFEEFIKRARNAAWENMAMSLLIITPIVLLLVYWFRRLIFQEAKMTQRLQESYDTNLAISQQLEESYAQLSAVDQHRKEMIANISHDLRTPLTNLSGYIETLYLRRENINMAERERFLTIALRESERLKKLIEDLFELSKLESSQIKLNLEPFSVSELLHDVLTKYEVVCAQKDIAIVPDFCEESLWTEGDLRLIDRVVQNLMDNAIRHNAPRNGQQQIFVSLQKTDNQIVVKISNTSATLPPSVTAQIFDRYFKASDEAGSSGLGLAIVKRILDLHSSKISVESRDNVTSFEFSLPIFGNL